MAQFDIYQNPNATVSSTPYLLDVQSDFLDGLESRIVIPLRLVSSLQISKLPAVLMPSFDIQGQSYLLDTPCLGMVPAQALQRPIGSLIDQQEQIAEALGFLFHSLQTA